MNKGKKLLSQTASVMMCLAMAGSSIAGVLPVWATSQDGDASDIQVTTADKPSATLFNMASDTGVSGRAGDTDGDAGDAGEVGPGDNNGDNNGGDGNGDDGEIGGDLSGGNLKPKDKYYFGMDGDFTQIDGNISVSDGLKLLMEKLGVDTSVADSLEVDLSFPGQSDELKSSFTRFYLPKTEQMHQIYYALVTFGTCELIVYDETEQFLRAQLTWDSAAVNGGGCVNVENVVTDDSYEGLEKIQFDLQGGSWSGHITKYAWRDSKETFGKFPFEPVKNGLVFRGWYTEPNKGGMKVEYNTQIPEIMDAGGKLYAYYSKPTVRIDFDLSGYGDKDLPSLVVYKGEPIKNTEEVKFPGPLVDDELIFVGWFDADGNGPYTEDTVVNENVVLSPKFDVDPTEYTIRFDANGGTLVGDGQMLVPIRSELGSLPAATKPGMKFVGWFTEPEGGTQVSVDTIPTGDTTYYAHFSNLTWTLTFDTSGGVLTGDDISSAKDYENGQPVTYLPGCSKAGYTFDGWYTEPLGQGTKFVEGMSLSEDTVIHAHFIEATDNKTLTFDANGGTLADADKTRTRNKGQAIGDLPTPAREGYIFDGWYTSKVGGSLIDNTYVVSVDETFYAHWTRAANPVTSVTINKVNGTAVSGNDKSYTMEISDPLSIEYGYAPGGADNAVFHWTSSDESVIRVSGDNLVLVGGGTTVLTIQTADGSKSDSIMITVNAPKVLVTSLYFDQPEQTVSSADGLDMGFKFGPRNAENAKWKWASSDPEILEIAADGSSFRLGGKLGDVTITLSTVDDAKSTTMTVHVIDPDDDDKNPPEEIKHTITFQTHGGSAVDPVKVVSGGDLDTLPTTTKAGYEFDGWALANGTKVSSLENITSDVVLYAQWTKIEEPDEEQVTVTFEFQNGVAALKQKVVPGGKLASLPTPTREGYTFLGWYTVASNEGGVKVTVDTVFDEDITVYARWENTATAGKYALTLDANGGLINGKSGLTKVDTPLEANKGVWNSIESFVPTRPGYTFNGWADENGTLVYDVNGEAIYGTAYWKDSDTYIGKDLTVYAQWMKNATKYELRYDTRGGNDIHPVFYEDGSVVTNFATPVNPGYIFDGWFTDASFKTPVTELTMDKDYTIYAKWTKETVDVPLKVYTVTFDSQGGSEVEPVKALEGTASELQTPVYAGHTFEGWFTEPEGGQRLTSLKVSHDMTLYAHWTEDTEKVVKTMITFDYNYEPKSTRKITATAGTELATLPIAARHGYVFDGWYDSPEDGEGEPYTTYTVGEEPATLYAHWTTDKNVGDDEQVMFTLTFESESGTYVEPITAPEGELITSLPVSEREGYVFDGWFTDPTELGDRVDTIELHTNATLYAHWREATAADEVWEVTLNDGVNTPHTWALNTDVAFSAFTTPVREGYTFVGWFTEEEGGTQVSGSYAYAGDKDVTFYAHWEKADAEKPDDKPTTPETPDVPDKPENPDKPDKPSQPENPDDNKPSTEKKVEYINLSQKELTKKMGEDLGLSFTYGPKGAVNAKFTWTSSNEDVMKVVTNGDGGQTLEYVAPGKTTLTVSTVDGSVSDSCELTVLDKDGNPSAAVVYTLNVTKPDGSTVKTYVKDFATLDKLFTKLGMSVANWGVKDSDAKVTGATTMKELVDIVGDKTIVLTAMDSDNKVIGSVEIAKSDEKDTYNVKMTLGDSQSGDDEKPDDTNGDDNNDGNHNDGNHNNGNNSNNGNTNGDKKPGNSDGSGNSNQNGNTNSGNDNQNGNSQNEVRTLNLTVVSVTGTTSNVKIQSNKTLAELAKALGYDNVAKWAVKQANISEYGVDGSTTMASLAELIEKNGDLAVMAYGSDGNLIGCAKVVADGKDTYKVSLSKDANVALRSAKEISDNGDVSGDSKGKDADDDKNTVTKDGKSDSTAPSVKTADSATLPLYGALGGVTTMLFGVVAFLKKKFRRV